MKMSENFCKNYDPDRVGFGHDGNAVSKRVLLQKRDAPILIRFNRNNGTVARIARNGCFVVKPNLF